VIKRLWIESFKAFAERPQGGGAGIPLQPFTVLVGPNGSGKSTILQAIDMLGWLSNATINEMLKEHGWELAEAAGVEVLREKCPASFAPFAEEAEMAGKNATV
jgi:predicted ATPase